MDQVEVGTAELRVRSSSTNYFFEATVGGKQYNIGQNQTMYLSKEVALGFAGVMIGLFAQGDESCKKPAIFKKFECDFNEK